MNQLSGSAAFQERVEQYRAENRARTGDKRAPQAVPSVRENIK